LAKLWFSHLFLPSLEKNPRILFIPYFPQDEHDGGAYHFLEDPDVVAIGVHSFSIFIIVSFKAAMKID
jgi:hypothetical protein